MTGSGDSTLSKESLDTGVTRVMILASALIVFSILFIGAFAYHFTEKVVVNKLKERDLLTIAESISTKVDAQINRAVEASLVLAHDPELLAWLDGGERDNKLRGSILRKTGYLKKRLNYSTTFIASAKTYQYWTEGGTFIDTLRPHDKNDSWFFQALASRKEVDINFDYNETLGDTYAFVNVLAGSLNSPSAVVGVGTSPHELSADFASYKVGKGINLWLIDNKGRIYLSDYYAFNGKKIGDIMAESAWRQVLEQYDDDVRVFDYQSKSGKQMDLISYPLKSIQLHLLVEIERDETVGFLRTIKWNAIAAVILTIIAIVFFFFYVSRKLASPYKRAIMMNKELEAKVEVRTRELSLRNEEMLDSINYAKLLQESVLPTEEELQEQLAEYYVIWRPRDLVGGDFYWMRRHGQAVLIAVGDCTGHGVPGAFMTLLAISALNRIVDSGEAVDPAAVLGKLNRLMKETLHQDQTKGMTDDGLDIGLVFIEADGVTYAGASSTLYRTDGDGLQLWKGDRRSIGYRKTPADYSYTNHRLPAGGACYTMTTDGFYDQNGGDHDYSFGKKRFEEMIVCCSGQPLEQQKTLLLEELETYMGSERQRDDITVLAFRIETPGEDGGEK